MDLGIYLFIIDIFIVYKQNSKSITKDEFTKYANKTTGGLDAHGDLF